MPIPQKSAPAPVRTVLRDLVHDKIRDAIMDGTFQPGEKLHDQELQEWLGVSRTPIREALNELHREGLIDMAPNRYTRVANPTEDQVLEALQTLGVMLGGVVRLAVPLLDDRARDEIIADLDTSIAACEAEDQKTLNVVVLRMFKRYVAGCGNSTLQRLCRDSMDGLAFPLYVANLKAVVPFTVFATNFEKLRAATLERDAIAAELATEALHLLPGVPAE